MQETWVQSLGWEDPLEKGKAIHSSILAWRTPWTMQKVRHDSATFTFHEATNAPIQVGCCSGAVVILMMKVLRKGTMLTAMIADV